MVKTNAYYININKVISINSTRKSRSRTTTIAAAAAGA